MNGRSPHWLHSNDPKSESARWSCLFSEQAVHWGIDELKAVVPIWKKEFFEDGSQWKENAESRARLLELPP
eukprot:1150449-Pelagomonas_calceolata.AAC.2